MNREVKVIIFEVSTGHFELWLCGQTSEGVTYPLPGTGGTALPHNWTEALQDYKERVKNETA